MDFPLPARALNLLSSSGKPARDSILLKLGQQIEAKVLQVSLANNIIKLQLGKTTVETQPHTLLSSNQNPLAPSPVEQGQTLKLLVTKLIPELELKIEKIITATEQENHLLSSPTKLQQVKLSSQIESNPITLKLLNKSDGLPGAVIKTVNHKIPILEVGQQIPAKAIAVNDKQIQFQLVPEQKTPNITQPNLPRVIIAIDLQKYHDQKNSINKADIPKLQIKTGQTVILEVSKAGKEPQFKILENRPMPPAPEKIISDTIKQHLPIQRSPEIFVNQLIKDLPALNHNANVPETLKRLAQQILHNLPQKSSLSQIQEIKQSIKNSGLFLESKLAQTESNQEFDTQADFKANVMKFLQALKHTPPPPQVESKAPLQEPLNLKQLQNNGESSVAKLVLDQINSLPKEENPKQIWHLELPYIDRKNVETISLQIEQDKEKHSEHGKGNWSVSITLTPPNLGKLHCKISCSNQTVSTHFWSDLTNTTNLISRNLDYLKAQLEASGLKTGRMESHQDMPIFNNPQNSLNTQLIDEQI